MSDYERHKGTIKRVFTDSTPKEFVLKLVTDGEITVPSYYNLEDEDDFREFSTDELLYYDYIVHNNEVFTINNTRCGDEYDIFEYNLKDNNTIDYHFNFYNGGTCLNEMLEEVLEKISNKGDK